jgi:hypothetical protein
VLGERFVPEPLEQPEPIRPEPFRQPPAYQPAYLPPPEPEAPRFEARYGESAAPTLGAFGSFNEPAAQLGSAGPPIGGASRDYDVLDRLNLIESQVAAIRSMTETINERLKNLDAKFGSRRY